MEKNNQNFLDKRRFIIISVSLLVSIALTVVTVMAVLNIDWDNLFAKIGDGLKAGGLHIVWFLILGAYIPFKFVSVTAIVMIRVKQLKIKIPLWEQFLYALTNSFLSFVTPANFVTDPYTIFWLKTNGLNNVQSSAIILSNAVMWQILQMIVTIPSLGIMCANYQVVTLEQEGLVVFWMMIAGLSLDVIIVTVLTVTAFNKRTQLIAAFTYNKIKQILRMKYHTPAQSRAKYLGRGEFQIQIMNFLKDVPNTILIGLILLVMEIMIYVLLCVSLLFIAPNELVINVGQIFNEANVAITANKFIPLPGGQGTLEWCLKTLMVAEKSIDLNDNTEMENLVGGSIILWRASSVYVPAGLGVFGMGWLTVLQFKKSRENGKLF